MSENTTASKTTFQQCWRMVYINRFGRTGLLDFVYIHQKNLGKIFLRQILNLSIVGALKNSEIFVNLKVSVTGQGYKNWTIVELGNAAGIEIWESKYLFSEYCCIAIVRYLGTWHLKSEFRFSSLTVSFLKVLKIMLCKLTSLSDFTPDKNMFCYGNISTAPSKIGKAWQDLVGKKSHLSHATNDRFFCKNFVQCARTQWNEKRKSRVYLNVWNVSVSHGFWSKSAWFTQISVAFCANCSFTEKSVVTWWLEPFLITRWILKKHVSVTITIKTWPSVWFRSLFSCQKKISTTSIYRSEGTLIR